MSANGKAILVISAIAVVFVGILIYNGVTNRNPGRYLRQLHDRIATTEAGLSNLQNEQATLNKAISSNASRLLQKQRLYEARMADENDDKLKSVWGAYRQGFVLNRMEVLKLETKLDTLRDVTVSLHRATTQLDSIQGVLSGSNSSSGSSNSEQTGLTLEQRIAHIDEVSQVAVQVVSEAKNEIAEQRSSLKEEQRKIEALVPAGADENNPVTKELFNALESALRENRNTQALLDQVDQSVTDLGKWVFAIRDISKAQSDFHKARSL